MVNDFNTSFISEASKSRRADSPGPSVPDRSKKPTPCLYSTICVTGSSAGCASMAARNNEIEMRLMGSPLWECSRGRFPFGLFAHYFNDDAFGALSVELGVIDLLPRPEIQLATGHRHNHFVVHNQALQMRVAIGFAGAMMAVIFAERRQVLQP